MNGFMIKRLVLKDWYFQRWAIGAYLATGALGLVLIATGSSGGFYAGTVLLITVMITAGIILAMSVVGERSEQTLPFVMSLPISPTEYAVAKIVANLSLFLVTWTALALGTLILFAAGAPGLIPFAAILLVEMFAGYCLLLMVAIVTESQGWTIGVMAIGNLFFHGFLYYVSHMPGIGPGMKGPVAVWNGTAITILAMEIIVSMLLLGLTFLLQARKRDFL